MTGFGFYPTSDIEHYQRMILHEFVVELKRIGMYIRVLCALVLLVRTY